MKKGFTLIELLTVVMVLAVLTAVAVPQYRRSVERARLAEATQMLPVIYDAVDRYFVSLPADGQQIVDVSNANVLNPGLAVERPGTGRDVISIGGGKTGFVEVAPAFDLARPAQPLFIEPEVTFDKLDLNLKGQAGEQGNVWVTPNFEYTIVDMNNNLSKNPYFVEARVMKGKYKDGMRLGYTGSQIVCLDGDTPGGCKLMGLPEMSNVQAPSIGGKIGLVRDEMIHADLMLR